MTTTLVNLKDEYNNTIGLLCHETLTDGGMQSGFQQC